MTEAVLCSCIGVFDRKRNMSLRTSCAGFCTLLHGKTATVAGGREDTCRTLDMVTLEREFGGDLNCDATGTCAPVELQPDTDFPYPSSSTSSFTASGVVDSPSSDTSSVSSCFTVTVFEVGTLDVFTAAIAVETCLVTLVEALWHTEEAVHTEGCAHCTDTTIDGLVETIVEEKVEGLVDKTGG